jgi:hypothetical protein
MTDRSDRSPRRSFSPTNALDPKSPLSERPSIRKVLYPKGESAWQSLACFCRRAGTREPAPMFNDPDERNEFRCALRLGVRIAPTFARHSPRGPIGGAALEPRDIVGIHFAGAKEPGTFPCRSDSDERMFRRPLRPAQHSELSRTPPVVHSEPSCTWLRLGPRFQLAHAVVRERLAGRPRRVGPLARSLLAHQP